MARTSKKKSAKASTPKKIEDAVVLSETAADTELASALSESSVNDTIDDVQGSEDIGAGTNVVADADLETQDTLTSTDQIVEEAAPAFDDQIADTPTDVAPVAAAQNVTVQKVGFLPLVGGGLVAGGLGFAAAWWGLDQGGDDVTPLLTEQATQIEALDAQIAAIPTAEMPDLSPLEASIESLRSETTETLAGIEASVADFDTRLADFETATQTTLADTDTRLTAVERAPTADGGVSETAIASFERELDGLRTEITSQSERMQEVADSAAADVAAAQEQLAEAEAQTQQMAAAAQEQIAQAEAEAEEAAAAAQAEAEAAEAQAQQALAAAAASQLRVAIEAGEPFETELAELEAAGVEVPEELSAAAADGFVTQADLQAAFPDLARAALVTARSEGLADQDAGGLTSFFNDQFGVRSVEPRDGDDPDAVLSRAEAALKGGDIDTTVTEISTLPDPVQATFADWLASTQARAAAIEAADALAPSNSN